MDQNEEVVRLQQIAKQVRKNLLHMIFTAQSGHPGGSLSIADIVTVLYFHEMRLNPQQPRWEDRDRFVLSKGHVCPVQYASLAMRGFFPMEELDTLRKFGSILQGHPDMKKTPGIDISTGSLGQGISCAVGMALACKRDRRESRVFAVLGDGECQEGQVWEAMEAAAKYKLNNLIVFVDNNGLQLDGTCDEVMPLQDLGEKFHAFGCETSYVDGNNIKQILQKLDQIRSSKTEKPHVIIAKTIKGKGVSFMENICGWHGQAPNAEEYARAIEDVEAMQ